MGMDEETKKAWELRWEDDNLHIVTVDGVHTVLEGAQCMPNPLPAGEYKDGSGEVVMTVSEPLELGPYYDILKDKEVGR